MSEKAKYWMGVCYPENMVDNWEEVIGDVLGVPYAYCVHDKDMDTDGQVRKKHVHILTAFPNTTTHNHAKQALERLSKDGCSCISTIESCISVRGSYNYLIHDTEACRKQGKYQYPSESRITGNCFDIGAYEQISISEKRAKAKELSALLIEKGFDDYSEWYSFVIGLDDSLAEEVALSYSGHFERLCKGIYHASSKKEKKEKRLHVQKMMESQKKYLEQMSEYQRLLRIREMTEMIEMGLDPETGELIEQLPF